MSHRAVGTHHAARTQHPQRAPVVQRQRDAARVGAAPLARAALVAANISDAAMRSPPALSSASGRCMRSASASSASRSARRPARRRRQVALRQFGPGAEALAPRRSRPSARARSMLRWKTQPETSANTQQHRHHGESRCAGRASSPSLQRRQGQSPSCLLREHVARAAHREHAARRLRVVLDRRADARDVDVDRAVEGLQRIALERVHDLVAREHAPGALRQHDEQVELVAGQLAGLAVDARGARAEVDLQAAEAQHLARRRPAAGARRSSALMRASSSRGSKGLAR